MDSDREARTKRIMERLFEIEDLLTAKGYDLEDYLNDIVEHIKTCPPADELEKDTN